MTQIAKRETSILVSLSERWGIETGQLIPITKATIFKEQAGKVSDHELMAFLMVCDRYNLSPFMRQIHAFYDRRGVVVPIVGVDGWVDLINRERRYRGVQFKVHEDEKTGKLIAYTCYLHVEGLVIPVDVTERLTECYRNTDPWNKMPHRMLRHKSLIQAARYAFGYTGIYDEDEGRDIVAGTIDPIVTPLSLQEAQEEITRVADSQQAPPPPPKQDAPAEEQEQTEKPQVQPGCPGCQVPGMVHLEDCPNRPRPEGEQEAKEPKAGAFGGLPEPAPSGGGARGKGAEGRGRPARLRDPGDRCGQESGQTGSGEVWPWSLCDGRPERPRGAVDPQ